ncbi:hypothetical protein ACJX0J_011267, partial [Zea mays]
PAGIKIILLTFNSCTPENHAAISVISGTACCFLFGSGGKNLSDGVKGVGNYYRFGATLLLIILWHVKRMNFGSNLLRDRESESDIRAQAQVEEAHEEWQVAGEAAAA